MQWILSTIVIHLDLIIVAVAAVILNYNLTRGGK